jgi:hypothetical protein
MSSIKVSAEQADLNPFCKADFSEIIDSIDQAPKVFDFEKVARKVLPLSH